MRLFLAILICKLSRAAIRLLGRGGTSLPGKLALRIHPHIIKVLSKGIDTVLITGTNGKTTTARMTEKMLNDAGKDCFANRSGANLEQGIAIEYIANANAFGRAKKKYAVIECDEAAFKKVCPETCPKAVLVTNIFRDQLDRFGEISETINSIKEGLKNSPHTVLCLNADCSLTSSLAIDRQGKTVFYGINEGGDSLPCVSDANHCIRCGAVYNYEYRTFAHLGSFSCPDCGYKRQSPDISVSKIEYLGRDSSEIIIKEGKNEFKAEIALPALYNIYNALAAMSAAYALGISAENAAKSLSGIKSSFGRMESFIIGESRIKMILVKNPAGCDRAIEYMSGSTEKFDAVICLNDAPSDGTDISWIWDCDFEGLFENGSCNKIIVSGTRARDMRLRLKYAGGDESRMTIIDDDAELIKAVLALRNQVYIMPTYTAMLKLRGSLAELGGKKEYWK